MKILKIAGGILKTIIALFMVFYVFGVFFIIKDKSLYYWAVITIVFIFLPALFFMFFDKKFVLKFPKWKTKIFIAKIIYICLIVLLIIAMALRYNYKTKTEDALAKINNAVLTIDDVMGNNLPSKPIQELNDMTVAGFDVNNNGIRDDVELAIFEKYPDSAKIRAGMLQYALALQLELTEVINSETLVAVLQKRSDARACIDNAGPEINIESDANTVKEAFAITDNRKQEIEDYILNTDLRLNQQKNIFEKYMTTYSISSEKDCDIDISSLPN
jgi:hypothetical protein